MTRRFCPALVAFLALASAGACAAQGWPAADCTALLASGHPRPAWGSKDKLGQDALLMLINYQLAVAACQKDEELKLLRQMAAAGKAKAPEPKAPEPKPAAEPKAPAEPGAAERPAFPRLETDPKP